MGIRGLENIATEIRKKEDKYMRYTVLVEEVVSQEFAVEASSPEEALRVAENQYSKRGIRAGTGKSGTGIYENCRRCRVRITNCLF